MRDLLLMLSVGLPLLSLVVVLLILLWKMHKDTQTTLRLVLKDSLTENRTLRNLLVAQDVQTLAGLQSVTSPSTKDYDSSEVMGEPADLGEAIDYEERLAQHGYSTGDLSDDLESAGWARTVVKGHGEDPIAYSTD